MTGLATEVPQSRKRGRDKNHLPWLAPKVAVGECIALPDESEKTKQNVLYRISTISRTEFFQEEECCVGYRGAVVAHDQVQLRVNGAGGGVVASHPPLPHPFGWSEEKTFAKGSHTRA